MAQTNREILLSLRASLKKHSAQGFLLPVTDEYQGEYSADYARRTEYVSGFDGSAGMLLVLEERAALLTDGRYTLQASQQLDTDLIEVRDSGATSPAAYLREYMEEGAAVAYDPWLHTVAQIERLERALLGHVALLPLSPNPVDALWVGQPERPAAPIMLHDDALAGKSAAEKIAEICAQMETDWLLLTQPDAICWLLNIRGKDIPYNPLPLCYALLSKDGTVWLILNPAKMQGVSIADVALEVVDDVDMAAVMARLSKAYPDAVLGYEGASCPMAFMQLADDVGVTTKAVSNPITLLKAIKNPVEQENIRRAHAVDGKALTAFIDWFNALPEEAELSELEAIAKLESFRAAHADYLGSSFATIAGSGPHGAVIHYRATEETSRMIAPGEAFLVDSGGQYAYGTTDVTRTLFRGAPTDAFKRHFTLVLKGHIALARAVFPKGTAGHQLDVLARQYLWQDGLDYAHGTGHGVGHYLCVHEGPQGISKRAGNVALAPGMILSNEPGYYLEGHYGIRIESLVLVVEHPTSSEDAPYYAFETLTRAPIDLRLVDDALLSDEERDWLEAYHARY